MRLSDLKLKENPESSYGGLSHSEETLSEFMDDLDPLEKLTLEDVNGALKSCGILEINESNYPEMKRVVKDNYWRYEV
ncbi:hypothetical protein NGH46_13685 [Staphylococcus xylosus]|uniref:hypothetical protein n=1 Tax=Staphylococcus xylosus TaxID=1288 RepID=UPI002DBA5C0B|nr:hypothetical protein [Staphylococcus xylosus]MEB8123162.1 hypothetical protein [Staphylococcus xylosus]